LRLRFRWRTARIQQALVNLPEFMREKLSTYVQGVRLLRTAINGVLKRYALNGYEREQKAWKFFREVGRRALAAGHQGAVHGWGPEILVSCLR